MTPILLLGVLGAILAAAGVAVLAGAAVVRSVLVEAILAAVLGGGVLLAAGLLSGAARLDLLLGVAAALLPVLLALSAGAALGGIGRPARRVLVSSWAVLALPVVALVPFAVVEACGLSACGLVDFGAALPLAVSPAAALLPIALLPQRRPAWRRPGRVRLAAGAALLWLGFLAWLVHLEGALDAYTPRIAAAAGLAPLAAIAGWIGADRLRGRPWSAPRVVLGGLVSGMVAIAPGAASLVLPGAVVVGLLAGASAGGAASARRSRSDSRPARGVSVVLVAALIGLLAPAIAGEPTGFVFSARLDVVVVPVLLGLGVVAVSVLASLPAGLLGRNPTAGGERVTGPLA